jgi:tetratricopeptide (TPR) repeat protein
VLATLERLYLSRKRWADLRNIYDQQLAALTDPQARREALTKLACLCEEQLRDDSRAIAAYRELVDLAGFDPAAIDSLERVCTRAQEWGALADALTSALTHADEVARDRLHARLGGVYERLGEEATAISHYRSALERCPTYEDALNALERLYGQPHLRRDAAEALRPLYERAGAHAKLATALEVIAEGAATSERRIELLLRIGSVCELHLHDPVRAFGAYTRALIEGPGNRDTLARLESIADATDGWAALAEAYRTAFAVPLELADQIDLRWRLGRIYCEELDDLPRAIRCFQRVLDLNRNHSTALLGLDTALAASARWDDLAKLLGAHLAAPGRAWTGTELAATGGASRPPVDDDLLAAWRERTEREPSDLRARLGLARIYLSSSKPREAAALLRHGSVLYQDAGDATTASWLAARADAADAGHASVRRAAPRNISAPPATGRQLQPTASSGPWSKVIEVRLALAAREANPDRRGQHYYEAAIVYRDRLQQPAEALRWFEKAVDDFFHESQLPIVDASVRAIQAIEALHTAAGSWRALEHCYRTVISRLERRGGADLLLSMIWESLADLYRHRLDDNSASTHAREQAWRIRDGLSNQDHAGISSTELVIE